MKKMLILLCSIVLFLSFVHAEELITQEDSRQAGITPDKLTYFLDVAIERIQELFSENSKLIHAQERLAEVKVMIAKNKIEHAERARIRFENIRLRMKNQTEIENEKKLIDNLGMKISAIASIKGKLNETQREEIKLLIQEHKIEIENLKGGKR